MGRSLALLVAAGILLTLLDMAFVELNRRYRSDLVHREILPDLRCWFLNDCHLSAAQATRPLRFKEVEFRDGYVTPHGWNPQAWDGTTTGLYGGAGSFRFPDSVRCGQPDPPHR